ncbi:MAG: B12-binding domain-containing protein [Betaproteobacteria bacterium]|nr:B12-binding domain-containing protein [Betaproteobacteria bacterium]
MGIADQVPPGAIFSRLQRIGERVEKEGALPLRAGAARPVGAAELSRVGQGAGAAAPVEDARAREEPDDAIYAEVRLAVAKGKHVAVKDHVAALLERGVPTRQILDRGLIAAIDAVGKRMAAGQAFIPEVLLAARAMSAAIGVLEPHLAVGGEQRRGRIVIGTVTGDLHDIGKNLVVTMMRGVGFEVFDLGPAGLCGVRDRRPPCDQTMMERSGKPAACRSSAGRRFEAFARQIGADGFAPDAVAAVALANRFMAGAPVQA